MKKWKERGRTKRREGKDVEERKDDKEERKKERKDKGIGYERERKEGKKDFVKRRIK